MVEEAQCQTAHKLISWHSWYIETYVLYQRTTGKYIFCDMP